MTHEEDSVYLIRGHSFGLVSVPRIVSLLKANSEFLNRLALWAFLNILVDYVEHRKIFKPDKFSEEYLSFPTAC